MENENIFLGRFSFMVNSVQKTFTRLFMENDNLFHTTALEEFES